MNCETTHNRFSLAEYWLKQIEDVYHVDSDIIESYTEYFLIICRSIEDYVISDFLQTLQPKISFGEITEIIRLKDKYRNEKEILHAENQKIKDFLKIHNDEVINFQKQLLVKYFRTLRNWTVHTIFPHIYENQHGENNTILHRYFQRNFVNYLGLEQGGGHLLLESGFSLLLANSDEDSIFDKYPLNSLSDSEKSQLRSILENKEAKDLLNEYLSMIKKFIEKFESP